MPESEESFASVDNVGEVISNAVVLANAFIKLHNWVNNLEGIEPLKIEKSEANAKIYIDDFEDEVISYCINGQPVSKRFLTAPIEDSSQ